MELPYPSFTPLHLRYRHCPMCTGRLVAMWDADGLFRPHYAACGWTFYPPNVYGTVVVITTPEGVVFLFPLPAGRAGGDAGRLAGGLRRVR